MAKTILIIEDDNFLLGLEAKKLEKKGYNVLTSANSVEAFEIINKKKDIDLLLLDLLLPDIDGFEILKTLREKKILDGVPIIIFSNLYEKEDIEKAKKFGINEFMIKANFTLDELAEKIEVMIGV